MKKTCLAMMTASLLFAISLLTACNKKENTEQSTNAPSEQQAAPAGAATPIDPATAAKVSGTVKFGGTAPKPAKIDMSPDSGSKGPNESEAVCPHRGNLANKFVYVKDGLGSLTFDVPNDACLLDQTACKY